MDGDDTGAFDSRGLRDALGCYGTGVAIAATRDADGAPVGLTINSFSSVSLDPPLILWSLDLNSGSLSVFRQAQAFSISVLSQEQAALARRFASPVLSRFGDAPHHEGSLGVPVIGNALASFECAVEARHPGGDHEIIIGRVRRISHRLGGRPLLFWKGRFCSVADA